MLPNDKDVKAESEHNVFGTYPVMEFTLKSIVASNFNCPSSLGIELVILFRPISRVVSELSRPMEVGMVPESFRPDSNIDTTLPLLHATPPQLEVDPEQIGVDGVEPKHCHPHRPRAAGLREVARSHSD